MKLQTHKIELDPEGISSPSDKAEQQMAPQVDDLIPTFGYAALPVVGIGGSAGSIQALQELFRIMPGDTGLIFVVVIHLADEHDSILDQILDRCTTMPVIQVRNSVEAVANHIYVIAPGKQLTMVDGRISVEDLNHPRGRRVAVDLFFRTLADTHGPHSTGIILSGTGGDGAIGMKRIKERGGVTICQDPREAEFPGMPQTSIATGMVDWVLPVLEIPRRLVKYQQNAAQLRSEAGAARPGGIDPAVLVEVPGTDDLLREILSYVHLRTGRDFSKYKQASVLRRIARRMHINSEVNLVGYLDYLRSHPGETGALLQDLLISVTNFFRDKAAFAALELELPRLFLGKGLHDYIRVWVPACATGEEAYSLAILLWEQAAKLENPPKIQIFATDLDEEAIRIAREGAYPEAIGADVSEERLRKFFTKEPSGYRIHRDLRETILFAVHDLLKDSPFSRLDLISCRNLLIYLNRPAQEHCMQVFHFGLNPEGILFVGASETGDDGAALFYCEDNVHRIFTRRALRRGAVPVPIPQLSQPPHLLFPASRGSEPLFTLIPRRSSHSDMNQVVPGESRIQPLEALHFQLLEHLSPPSVLADLEHNIIHVSSSAGRYLRVPGGGPQLNLLQMIHPDLRVELLAALLQARESGRIVEVHDIAIELEGSRVSTNLKVMAVPPERSEYLMVVFEEGGTAPLSGEQRSPDEVSLVARLEAEIERLKSQLRSTVDQYTTSTEEMRASNEELHAVNEEMRSATEELETGREELQSINEELTTVNQELKSNIEELGRSNSDLQNLISSTNIATVFLDRDLCIKRYTPNANQLFKLIPGDVGRPLSDLSHNLLYNDMTVDAERILRDLEPVEQEVQSKEGRWYLMRLSPYRTTDDQIAGVVFSFLDFTERRLAEEGLRESEERLRLAIQAGRMGTWDWNLETGQVLWSPEHNRMYGIPEDRRVGSYDEFMRHVHPEDQEHVAKELREALKEKRYFSAEMRSPKPDGSTSWISGKARATYDAEDRPVRMIGVVFDITESKKAADDLRLSEARFRSLVNQSTVGIIQTTIDGTFNYVNDRFCEITGRSAEELLNGMHMKDITHPDDIEQIHALLMNMVHTGEAFSVEKRIVRPDGNVVWVMNNVTPLLDSQGNVVGRTSSTVDITDRKAAEMKLLQMATALDTELAAMTRLHELSTRLTAHSELLPTLEEVLDAAIEIQHAEFGMIQLVNPMSGELEIAVQRGFSVEVLSGLVELDDFQKPCQVALRTQTRQVIQDLASPDVPAELEAFQTLALEPGCRTVQCTPLIDRTGKALGVLSTQFTQPRQIQEQDLRATDLYAQQAADMISFHVSEEQIRRSEERLRRAISIETVGIIFFDRSGIVTEANQAFLEMSAYTKEDLARGIGWDDMMPTEWRQLSESALQELEAKGSTRSYEAELLRKDGSRFWALISTTLLSENQVAQFIIDISATKAGQWALEESRANLLEALRENERVRADLEAADKAKDQFLAVLSHELRTPLTPVLMAIHFLKETEGLPVEADKALSIIKRNVETECKLIDDLLDLTRISRGTMEIESEPVDLHETIKQASVVCRSEVDKKHHKLTMDLAAANCEVTGDRTRLEQVFWNLLKNACKFTPKSGDIRVVTYSDDDWIRVDITDTGIGLAEGAAEKIFDAFAQASEEIKQKHGGLGLGLAISKATVEAHGGTIQAESEGTGKGATFTVKLPLAK